MNINGFLDALNGFIFPLQEQAAVGLLIVLSSQFLRSGSIDFSQKCDADLTLFECRFVISVCNVDQIQILK